MLNPLSVLGQIVAVFNQLQISYVVVGSFASSVHGMYRSTAAIDFLVDLQERHIAPLVNSLHDSFYLEEESVRRAVHLRGSFNAIHLESVFKVDVFVLKDVPFDRKLLERRELRPIAPDANQFVNVASAEDTILAKLRWYRSGNEISKTQWSDVVGIIGVSSETLNGQYLSEWSGRLGVADLLSKAFLEAGVLETDQNEN